MTPITAFLLITGMTLLLCLMFAADRDDLADFYSANRSLPALRNALALSGDYISAVTLLTTTGVVALAGFDGMSLAVSTVAALGVLLLLAEPLRRSGAFTLGDTLQTRFPGSATRIAAATATLFVCVPFTIVQLSGAGVATAHLIGFYGPGAAQVCTLLIGALMITFASVGGMRGTSVIQMVKAVVVFLSMAATALVLLHHFHWRLDTLLEAAAQGSGRPDGYRAPGMLLGTGLTGRLDYLSLHITVVLGAACTPHVVMRLNAARSGATARRSTGLAIGMVGAFCGLAVLLGLGASATIGAQRIAGSDPRGNTALLLLAGQLTTDTGGSSLFTAVVCAVFLTSLAVVAGLTLSAAASLAHDVYAQVVHRGSLSTQAELNAARWATLLVGAGSAGLSVALQGWNVQFLSQFAVAAAASAVLPALAYTVFRRDFTRKGLLWSVYGGLGCCLLLEVFGPTVSGTPGSLFPHQDFHWFPLENTGLVSVPAGFLLGWWGSRRSGRHASAATAGTRHPAMR